MNNLTTFDCEKKANDLTEMEDESKAEVRFFSARQWLIFPSRAPARSARLRSFRLLVEKGDGKLVLVELKLRNLTTIIRYGIIGILMVDAAPYAPHSESFLRLYELGVQPVFLDEPVKSVGSFCTPDIVGEAILDDFLVRTQLGEQVTSSHRADLEKNLKDELCSRLNLFTGNLKEAVVQTISEIHADLKPTTYNFLTGRSDSESFNLLQSARVFPVLIPALASGNAPYEIMKAIQTRKPLLEAVAKAYNIPKSVPRSTLGIDLATVGHAWADQPKTLFRLLATLKADFRPVNAEDWKSFNTAVQAISQSSGMPPLCSRNRLWLAACAARKFKVDNLGAELARAAIDIDEFTSALVAVLNFELRRDSQHHSVHAINAVDEFLANQNDIIKFAKLAQRYEAAYLRESAEFANAEEKALLSGACWKSVLEAPFVTTLRTIHHLVTAEELLEDGADMQHCVGGYAVYCLSGGALIFSVRDREGQRCSTFHVSISQDGMGNTKINYVQHRGKRNAEPSRECKMASLSLLRHLNQDQKYLAAFLTWRKNIAGMGKDMRTLHILTRPMIGAIRKVLPGAWPLEKLIALTKKGQKS